MSEEGLILDARIYEVAFLVVWMMVSRGVESRLSRAHETINVYRPSLFVMVVQAKAGGYLCLAEL